MRRLLSLSYAILHQRRLSMLALGIFPPDSVGSLKFLPRADLSLETAAEMKIRPLLPHVYFLISALETLLSP
jgi:hypothetical protein